jgi:ubiquitin carboxyl-terminal hydrolase 7
MKGELFSKTKERLSERLKVKGKTFEKIKFAVVPRSGYGKPEYLSHGKLLFIPILNTCANSHFPEDILSEKLVGDDILGLDHQNKTRTNYTRADQIFIK